MVSEIGVLRVSGWGVVEGDLVRRRVPYLSEYVPRSPRIFAGHVYIARMEVVAGLGLGNEELHPSFVAELYDCWKWTPRHGLKLRNRDELVLVGMSR